MRVTHRYKLMQVCAVDPFHARTGRSRTYIIRLLYSSQIVGIIIKGIGYGIMVDKDGVRDTARLVISQVLAVSLSFLLHDLQSDCCQSGV